MSNPLQQSHLGSLNFWAASNIFYQPSFACLAHVYSRCWFEGYREADNSWVWWCGVSPSTTSAYLTVAFGSSTAVGNKLSLNCVFYKYLPRVFSFSKEQLGQKTSHVPSWQNHSFSILWLSQHSEFLQDRTLMSISRSTSSSLPKPSQNQSVITSSGRSHSSLCHCNSSQCYPSFVIIKIKLHILQVDDALGMVPAARGF